MSPIIMVSARQDFEIVEYNYAASHKIRYTELILIYQRIQVYHQGSRFYQKQKKLVPCNIGASALSRHYISKVCPRVPHLLAQFSPMGGKATRSSEAPWHTWHGLRTNVPLEVVSQDGN